MLSPFGRTASIRPAMQIAVERGIHKILVCHVCRIGRLLCYLTATERTEVAVFLCTILTNQPGTDDLNICFALFAILQGDAINDIFYWKIAKKNPR